MVYVVDTEVVGTYFLPAHTKPLAKTHDRFVPISVGWNQRRPALHASSVISASVMDLRNSKECMLCGAGVSKLTTCITSKYIMRVHKECAMEQVPINSTMAKSAILELPLLGEVSRSPNARSEPGTIQIVYVDFLCRDVLKPKNSWVLKSL